KENSQKRADVAEKKVAELNEKLLDAQNEVSVQQEENEKEKKKTEEIMAKTIDELMKRKEVETEKEMVEEQNWKKENVKQDNKDNVKQEQDKKQAMQRRQRQFPTIAINNPDPADFAILDVDGMKKIIKKRKKYNTLSLVQVLENGIWSMETEFNNSHGGAVAIGIVQDSYEFPAGVNPGLPPHTDYMAVFVGKGWNTPQIYYQGNSTLGMTGFGDNEIARLEYDSLEGTLFLFVNNQQQPLFVEGIKDRVRFIISMRYADSSCTIRTFRKLDIPESVQMDDEQAVQW
ncbi:MAG: hypothetical protein EZS28_020184, partial [Streblomastix strix]